MKVTVITGGQMSGKTTKARLILKDTAYIETHAANFKKQWSSLPENAKTFLVDEVTELTEVNFCIVNNLDIHLVICSINLSQSDFNSYLDNTSFYIDFEFINMKEFNVIRHTSFTYTNNVKPKSVAAALDKNTPAGWKQVDYWLDIYKLVKDPTTKLTDLTSKYEIKLKDK